MKLTLFLAGIFLWLHSCKLQPESNRNFDKDRAYSLRLKPSPGSVYHYEITNETNMILETEGKEVSAINKSTVDLRYAVAMDSAGNYVFTTSYDKISLYTKSGDQKTERNTDNAAATLDPTEKMLGILKSASIVATVTPKGEVIQVSGYKELGDQLIAGFDENDHMGRSMAEHQWEKTVGNGIVKSTMEQLFKIFPDSVIRIGDSWKLDSEQQGELPMRTKSIYTLRAINDDIALLSAEGIIACNGLPLESMGLNNARAELKGNQTADFELETNSGMLIHGQVKASITGTLQMMGREIPIAIKTTVKIKGKKN